MFIVPPGRRRAAVLGCRMLGLCRGVSTAALLMLAAAPAVAGSGASNSATLTKAHEIRAKLAAAGFSDIVNLQEREGGRWSCRAIRFGTVVRVEVDRDGQISIV